MSHQYGTAHVDVHQVIVLGNVTVLNGSLVQHPGTVHLKQKTSQKTRDNVVLMLGQYRRLWAYIKIRLGTFDVHSWTSQTNTINVS